MGSPLWRLLEMLVPNCVATDVIEISGQSVEIVCSSQTYADVDKSDSSQLDVSLYFDDTPCHIDLEPLLER
jgi:hypothetical protein